MVPRPYVDSARAAPARPRLHLHGQVPRPHALDDLLRDHASGFTRWGISSLRWAPHFITAIMGSVFQIAVPIVCVVYFARQPDYFGMSVGGFWLSYSLYELSAYVGDARSKDLPLVGFAASEDLEHDWGYILGALHMLPADHFFAFLLRVRRPRRRPRIVRVRGLAARLRWRGRAMFADLRHERVCRTPRASRRRCRRCRAARAASSAARAPARAASCR